MASRGSSSSSNSSRARNVRLEEYASSGAGRDAAHRHDSNSAASASATSKLRAPSTTRNSSNAIRGRNAASTSHRQNDDYMDRFDAGYEEIYGATAVAASDSSSTDSSSKRAVPRRVASVHDKREPTRTITSSRTDHPNTTDTVAAHALRPPAVGDLDGAWRQGPSSPEGTLYSVSAQPLMCMSLSADAREVVVGSSDHALYALPLSATGVRSKPYTHFKPRTLYTKTYGHAEWVTCVTHLSDNRIVSGGMDAKLCLWDAVGVRCEVLTGHSGSVSLVLPLTTDLLASAGYDKTIRIWQTAKRIPSRDREVGVIKAATAPILDAAVLGTNTLVSGDRDGTVAVIDVDAARVTQTHRAAHRGHTTSVLGSAESPQTYYSGGQDGVVNVWDTRQATAVHSLAVHVDACNQTRAAVGFVCEPSEDVNTLVTAGADGVINVLDKRQVYAAVHTLTDHRDFIYALTIRGPLCFSGAGNGMLHVHDWRTGSLLYGLGANQAAVRAIAVTPTQLVAAGDDGGVVVYDMQ